MTNEIPTCKIQELHKLLVDSRTNSARGANYYRLSSQAPFTQPRFFTALLVVVRTQKKLWREKLSFSCLQPANTAPFYRRSHPPRVTLRQDQSPVVQRENPPEASPQQQRRFTRAPGSRTGRAQRQSTSPKFCTPVPPPRASAKRKKDTNKVARRSGAQKAWHSLGRNRSTAGIFGATL